MANLLPILLLGGGAVVLMSKKKKKKKKPTDELVGGSCASLPPSVHEKKEAEGFVCDYETGQWVPSVGGEDGLPPKYLENEKVDAEVWGSMEAPGVIPLHVGQDSFTNFGGMKERVSVVGAGSTDPNIVSIGPDTEAKAGEWNPIAIFRPRAPGSATLAIRRSDGSEYALNVTVTGE